MTLTHDLTLSHTVYCKCGSTAAIIYAEIIHEIKHCGGEFCFYKISDLRENLGLARGTVINSIQALKQNGFLIVNEDPSYTGQGIRNRYSLNKSSPKIEPEKQLQTGSTTENSDLKNDQELSPKIEPKNTTNNIDLNNNKLGVVFYGSKIEPKNDTFLSSKIELNNTIQDAENSKNLGVIEPQLLSPKIEPKSSKNFLSSKIEPKNTSEFKTLQETLDYAQSVVIKPDFLSLHPMWQNATAEDLKHIAGGTWEYFCDPETNRFWQYPADARAHPNKKVKDIKRAIRNGLTGKIAQDYFLRKGQTGTVGYKNTTQQTEETKQEFFNTFNATLQSDIKDADFCVIDGVEALPDKVSKGA